MFLTYRYRLLPSKKQHRVLETILEGQRQLYNAALQERIDAHSKAGINRSYFDQTKALTEWRREDAEARRIPIQIHRATLKWLDQAYQGFFRRWKAGGPPGFPRFRGTGRFKSFGFRVFSGISLDGNRVCFEGLPGSLRIHMHRPVPESASIKACTFTRTDKGWAIGLCLQLPDPSLRRGERAIGIDLGLTHFAVLSDGTRIPSLRAARRSERRLRQKNRAVSRASQGSKGQAKARGALRRVHASVVRQRNDFLHRASAQLVREYDIIAIERMVIFPMAAGPTAKDVHDASWSRFISMLRYKAGCAGARLIEVDVSYSSQDCSECGARVAKPLRERTHRCPECGLTIDRDLNAALNVLNRAGAGPGLHNADVASRRAGVSLGRTCRDAPKAVYPGSQR